MGRPEPIKPKRFTGRGNAVRCKHWSALLVLLVVWLAEPGQQATAAPPLPSLFPSLFEIGAPGLGGKLPRVRVEQGLPPRDQFSVPIPARSWRLMANPAQEPRPGKPRRLAAFLAPEGAEQGLVEVLDLELSSEADAADFSQQLMVSVGYLLQAERLTYTSSGLAFEALGKKPMSQGEPYFLRGGIWRSGRRLYWVWCSAREGAFTRLAPAFALCVAGFKLAHPQPEALVGYWQPRCLADTLCYQGPWDAPQARQAPGTPVVEHVYHLRQGGRLTGTLQVALILPPEADKQTPQQRLQVLLRYLATKGAKINFQSRAVEVRHRKMGGRAFFLSGRGSYQDTPVEIRAFSLAHSPWAALVWLRTLGPEQDRAAWMSNKRTFQIITRSLQAMHQEGGRKK